MATLSSSSSSNDIVTDLSPFIRVYRDGTVDRLCNSPTVPPSPQDSDTAVSSKDIKISSHVSARLYLPSSKLLNNNNKNNNGGEDEDNEKLPILVYYHGGGFCLESAFSSIVHRYLNHLVSHAKIVAVSVEYRLAPEIPLPAGFQDSWTALQWVASHSHHHHQIINNELDPWLLKRGDFTKLYLGGDSAGGTIVHYVAMRAGSETIIPGNVKILGGFISHPFYWGSKSEQQQSKIKSNYSIIGGLSSSSSSCAGSGAYQMWKLVYPSAPGGIDNPFINPLAEDAPSLSRMGCSRLLVIVSEYDDLRENGVTYVEALKKSGWEGEVELIDVDGEDHCFHVFNPDFEKPKNLICRIASFINTNK